MISSHSPGLVTSKADLKSTSADSDVRSRAAFNASSWGMANYTQKMEFVQPVEDEAFGVEKYGGRFAISERIIDTAKHLRLPLLVG